MKSINKTLNKAMIQLQIFKMNAQKKLRETDGQFVWDNLIVIVIILVLGGLLLKLLYPYIKDSLAPQVQNKVTDTLNYNG